MNPSNHTCLPCDGNSAALLPEKSKELLTRLEDGWQINLHGHLEKTYRFKTFLGAMNFANKITEIAENQGHHPDFYISWGVLRVEIWTHKINGLTENDFYLATKIKELEH